MRATESRIDTDGAPTVSFGVAWGTHQISCTAYQSWDGIRIRAEDVPDAPPPAAKDIIADAYRSSGVTGEALARHLADRWSVDLDDALAGDHGVER